jgi:hypothetical protein
MELFQSEDDAVRRTPSGGGGWHDDDNYNSPPLKKQGKIGKTYSPEDTTNNDITLCFLIFFNYTPIIGLSFHQGQG